MVLETCFVNKTRGHATRTTSTACLPMLSKGTGRATKPSAATFCWWPSPGIRVAIVASALVLMLAASFFYSHASSSSRARRRSRPRGTWVRPSLCLGATTAGLGQREMRCGGRGGNSEPPAKHKVGKRLIHSDAGDKSVMKRTCGELHVTEPADAASGELELLSWRTTCRACRGEVSLHVSFQHRTSHPAYSPPLSPLPHSIPRSARSFLTLTLPLPPPHP